MTAAEKFCLQWNEFQTNVKTSYRGARKTEDYADVTLACEDGHQIRAHKIILSSSSLFFRDLLAGLPHAHPLVYMRGLKHQDLSNIIDFIYHGEAEVLKDDLESFLSIAGELSVKGMTKQAKNPQRENMSDRDRDSDGEMVEEKLLDDDEPPEKTHKTVTTEEEVGEKYFECDQCGKTYGTKASLRTHIYNHSKKQQTVKAIQFEDKDRSVPSEAEGGVVALLDTTVGDNVELEEKIDSLVEKRDGIWNCGQCGKTDNSRFQIRRHAETHLEGFTHQCPKCEKTSSTRGALDAHKGRMHPEEKAPKLFSCDTCGKPSGSLAAVRIHKTRNHQIKTE